MENGKANPPRRTPPPLPKPSPLATLMEQIICPRESLAEMKPRIRQETAKKARQEKRREDVAKVKQQRQE